MGGVIMEFVMLALNVEFDWWIMELNVSEIWWEDERKKLRKGNFVNFVILYGVQEVFTSFFEKILKICLNGIRGELKKF